MIDDPQTDRADSAGESTDEKLLREIREDYRYFLNYWREIREEAATDMRFVSGDPWDDDARKERADNGRPVICPDEISQYLNQAINGLRQNKRGVKVNPKGSGATDEDAEMRESIVRGIQYSSSAQAAYITAFEGAVNCGFGAFRLTTEYVSEESFEQQPRIKRIANQFTVLFDPDAKEADRSDQQKCFVVDTLRTKDFGDKYPDAQKKSFSADDALLAPDWMKGEHVVVAEYWRVEKSYAKKRQELPEGDTRTPLERRVEKKKVVQYITNGVEILEKNEWLGSWVPIIGVFGKELYLNDGGSSKLQIHSLTRMARHPQKMLAYIASQEAEEFGMAPRVPFVGYKGQFESDADAWETLNKVPRAYIQVDPIVDAATQQVLPLPSRPQFQPNAAAYEMSRESWRRAIQAAMGISPLPTSAQRQNEKSGVALQKIQTQEQVGSFHFTDNFDRALENCGRQLNELITKVMDTPRHVGIRNPDDSHALLQVTTSQHAQQQGMQQQGMEQGNDYLVIDRGEFDVTISTGPNFQSEREEASNFVDTLIHNIEGLPLAPPQKAALLAKAVKLKNIGPIGDEIAKILDPQGDGEEAIPPQAQAALAKAQQELQQIHAYSQQLEQELQKLQMEKQAKVVDNEARMAIERMKIEAQAAVAEIQTKAQVLGERAAFVEDLWKQLHGQAHERGMQAEEHAHAADQAQMAQAAAAQQAEQPQAQAASAGQ